MSNVAKREKQEPREAPIEFVDLMAIVDLE